MLSGDLKSNYSKSGNIWNPDFLKIAFLTMGFPKGGDLAMAIAIVGTILKTRPFQIGIFLSRFQMIFWQNGSYLSTFQTVGLPDFRSHLKSGPFATLPLFDHSKSRQVRISDPHCDGRVLIELTWPTAQPQSQCIRSLQFECRSGLDFRLKPVRVSSSRSRLVTSSFKFWMPIVQELVGQLKGQRRVMMIHGPIKTENTARKVAPVIGIQIC